MMLNILIADDHEIVRAGLKTCLVNLLPGAVVDEAGTGIATFEMIKVREYDLIILDIVMPATDSFTLVRNILAMKPLSKILMYSMYPDEVYARKHLEIGALGYLSKESDLAELTRAVTNVLENKRYISASVTEGLLDHALHFKKYKNNPFTLLSPRELEITRHLMRGAPVSEIGVILHLHTSTVGTYKARIFDKLGCTNLVALNELALVYNFNPPG